MKMFSLLMFASLVMSQAALADQSPLTVGYLRCEYRINPSGIDQLRPRLSWVLESSRRAQKQTAYQVVVATSARSSRRPDSESSDSGKVPGDDTTAVVYAGRALTSGVRVFWKVKVWDKSDCPSAWSQSATWSMGLLDPSDWKAQWIGCDKFRTPPAIEAEMDGAKWIWHAADPSPNPPKGQRLFYSTFTLPKTAVVKAKLLVTAADGVHVVLNTNQLASIPPGKDECRQVRVVDVTDKLKPGVNDIRAVVQVPCRRRRSAGQIVDHHGRRQDDHARYRRRGNRPTRSGAIGKTGDSTPARCRPFASSATTAANPGAS